MKKGDLVKYREPVNVHEEDERFIVLEDRGARVLVGSLFLNLPLPATTALSTDDLILAIPYDEGKEKGLENLGKTECFLICSPYPSGTRERLDWSRGYRETISRKNTVLL